METQPQSEKAGIGSQSTPPRVANCTNPAAPEIFSHAEPPSSSSFPLLRKLRVGRKWRAKWRGRKETHVDNEQQQPGHDHGVDEEEEEEDGVANDEESIMINRSSRSNSNRTSHMDDDNSRWKAVWAKVRRLFLLPTSKNPFWRIGYDHILMVISMVAIILLLPLVLVPGTNVCASNPTLLVAGCASHRMRHIYLLELSYHRGLLNASLDHGPVTPNPSFYSLVANISSTGGLTLRIGYFGICMATDTEDNSSSWTCRPKAKDLARQVVASQDLLNLLAIGDNFRDEVIVSVIIIMSIILIVLGFSGLSTFPGWSEDVDSFGEKIYTKPFPPMVMSTLILISYVLTSLFLLVAILWQHVAVVAHSASTEAAFNSAVRGKVGTAATVLGWAAIGVNCFAALGLGVMLVNLRLLRRLTDDDERDV